MKRNELIEYVGLLLSVAVVSSGTWVQGAPMDWVYEAAIPERTSGDLAAALDVQDHSHVVYGLDALYYDWEEADGWHSEMADSASAPDSISMVLDDASHPHVVYVDRLTSHVKYAHRDLAGWSIETIAQDAYIANGDGLAALCLDATGRPHVGYRTGNYQALQLKHLSQDESGWHVNTVGWWNGVSLHGLIISVADDGQPHLACVVKNYDSGGVPVFHAWRQPSGWQLAETVLPTDSVSIPLQFDATGRLHLVYQAASAIRYGLLTRGSLEDELIRDGGYSTSQRPLAVSRTGVPHVILGNKWNGLQHWTRAEGAWQQTVVDTDPVLNVALALDASNQPHVLYHLGFGSYPDYTYLTRRAWLDTGDWHSQADPSAPSIAGTLMVTQDHKPRLAYTSYGEKTAFYSGEADGWHERTLAQHVEYMTNIRLALDSHGNPHVVYNGTMGPPTGFGYAWYGATGWHATPLEEAKEYGGEGESDLAFDSQGRLHMGYPWADTDPNRGNGLRYTVRSGGTWESAVVNTNRIKSLALAIDGSDWPHFLVQEYVEATDGKNLVHIWQDGADWHRETVATLSFDPFDGHSSVYPGITVDRTGNLHICYFDRDGSNTLRYGYRATQGWQFTTVDTQGTQVGANCSMALDELSRPHIAYGAFDVTPGNHHLRYARQDDTSWSIASVDSVQTEYLDLGGVSLGLAPDGTAHIVYSMGESGGEKGFRYARSSESGWEVIDLESGIGESALAIDLRGRPHIAYNNVAARSNLAYLWPATVFHHISWNPIASPQNVGIPIPVTLTARNASGEIHTSFGSSATLSGSTPGRVGNSVAVGTGTNDWEYPLYTRYHDARTQAIYPARELDGSCTITSLAIEVTSPPGQTLENWTIRLKHTTRTEFPTSPEWETNGWTVVYQADEPAGTTGWRTFEFSTGFDYNGADNLLVDFSFNNASFSTEGQCRFEPAWWSSGADAYLSITAASDSKDGDPLDWSGASPLPKRNPRVPNIVLGATVPGTHPVAVSPPIVGPFVDGVWTGVVTVVEHAADLVLLVDDGAGHGGQSSPFTIQSLFQHPVILGADGQFGLVGGTFGFNVMGQVGQIVVIEGSADLLGWLPLQTNTMDNAPVYFSDPDSPSYPHRYYRLLQP